jgi:DUF2934 family protein
MIGDLKRMPSRIYCKQGHSTKAISVYDAAIALAEGRPMGVCKKCGNDLEYRMEHPYAGDRDEQEHGFTVTGAVRLGTRLTGDDNCDPFLLVLRDMETGKQQVLPTFWFRGQGKTPRGGQFPPLLTLAEWKRMFGQLDATFHGIEERIRLRAYELYEKRGKREGFALQDWLQAEAELKVSQALRAA